MGFLQGWKAKLRDTNEALAAAHKSWRDDQLGRREQSAGEREQSLARREAEVALLVAEMRAIEARQWRRKVGFLLTAAVTGAIGLLLGTIFAGAPTPSQQPLTTGLDRTAEESPANSAPTVASARIANTEHEGGQTSDAPPATSSRPHYSDPDGAASRGQYGTGKNFNVGWYCLDKEEQGEVTFEECLGAAALALSSSR